MVTGVSRARDCVRDTARDGVKIHGHGWGEETGPCNGLGDRARDGMRTQGPRCR
jgi:hypothetical protein